MPRGMGTMLGNTYTLWSNLNLRDKAISKFNLNSNTTTDLAVIANGLINF